MRVLVVEDDLDVAENICDFLQQKSHVVDVAMDGLSGLRLAERDRFDALVLDLSLPRLDGLEICRRLRAAGATPAILMLTARDALEDKLDGFDSGADDYLVKPFALPELEARLRALSERGARWGRRELKVGDLVLNVDTREVRRGDRLLTTTRAVRRILELLMQNAHRVVTRAEFEEMLWPGDTLERDSLRSHIHALRKAIDIPGEASMIVTVTGEGYRLVDRHA